MTEDSVPVGPEEAIRRATSDDALAVRRLLDAAFLETRALDERLVAGDVLVAVDERSGAKGTDPVGVVVLEPRTAGEEGAVSGGNRRAAADETGEPADRTGEPAAGAHVVAIAVRRRRRDRGIGTALIEAALEREGQLTAAFDESVRPFYESLDFSIEAIEGSTRLWGALRSDASAGTGFGSENAGT